MNTPALTLYYDGNCSICRALVAPLKWRMLRPLFAAMYRTLARNRYRLSRCADGVCSMARKS